MTVKQCDRCGKTYNLNSKRVRILIINLPERMNMVLTAQ